MKKEFIDYKDLIKRNSNLNKVRSKGYKIIDKANKYKKFVACALITIGVLTLPFPTGSLILIGIGFGMLGLTKEDIKRFYKLLLYKQKAKRKFN